MVRCRRNALSLYRPSASLRCWRSFVLFLTASAMLGGLRPAAAQTTGPTPAPGATIRSLAHKLVLPAADDAHALTRVAPGVTGEATPVAGGGGWTLYSGAANRIEALAAVGDETWLGTGMGVKRIDRKAGVVRHYTRIDGLPGDTVRAIGADDAGAWCLVQAPISDVRSVFACRWDRATDRWETLRTWKLRFPSGLGGSRSPAPSRRRGATSSLS